MIQRRAAIAGFLVLLAWVGYCWPLATGGEPAPPAATEPAWQPPMPGPDEPLPPAPKP